MAITNILFDLGGVIIDLDYTKTFQAFADLGIPHEQLNSAVFCRDLLLQYEIGAISTEDFRNAVRKELGLALSNQEFDKAWNAMIGGLPLARLHLLQQLRETKNYRTFLFSNINDLHYEKVLEVCRQQHGLQSLNDYFHKEYYSHLFGQRKPDVAAFLQILEENGLLPEQTVFVDDLLVNVEGAKEAGLHVVHFSNGLKFEDVPGVIASL